MRHAYRYRPADLTLRLLTTPQVFEFHQAIRLLRRVLVRTKGEGVRAKIRFRNSVSLSYPAGDIESIRIVRDGRAIDGHEEALAALTDPAAEVDVEVTPAFMGLFGTFGGLPLAYTEWLSSLEMDRQGGMVHPFIDLLTRRAMEQYCEAWRYRHPVVAYEESDANPLARSLASLAGQVLSSDVVRHARPLAAIPDNQVASICAGLRQTPMSAPYLSRILSVALGETIRVEDFVGAWYDLPGPLRASLGNANMRLGADMILGSRSWRRDVRVRIHIGPLRLERYRAFLPKGEAAASLRVWLANTVGSACEFEVIPMLHRDDVQGIRLGPSGFGQLGRDAFLSSGPAQVHRGDGRYILKL
ncbi:type VI secretion system baseplate subunit TssG [Luteibacter sp. 22Crub2.1]|uniref:type VI secretion system baseplate subunit TssG n=1 Tax=Luteibacter sp. 22Crub2.1 TaxID=1283288 RepID=UPI0009A6612E|nr:type VI secretion system baseplate subunit TssG [Luteibacter sp. 22Crub2.1]SKB47006.1 type VI secretion system protein ImpH [Luteibacter sp. 22Crub2.1]